MTEQDRLRYRANEIAASYYPYVNCEGDHRDMWKAMINQICTEYEAAFTRIVTEAKQ